MLQIRCCPDVMVRAILRLLLISYLERREGTRKPSITSKSLMSQILFFQYQMKIGLLRNSIFGKDSQNEGNVSEKLIARKGQQPLPQSGGVVHPVARCITHSLDVVDWGKKQGYLLKLGAIIRKSFTSGQKRAEVKHRKRQVYIQIGQEQIHVVVKIIGGLFGISVHISEATHGALTALIFSISHLIHREKNFGFVTELTPLWVDSYKSHISV